MRPLKEMLIEEYWNIGFRTFSEDDSVIDGGRKSFNMLEATKRFWYADPFLFEKSGKTYLFVEMFDNVTEVGIIGCSVYENGTFTEPLPVIKESFHLSYPYVFEKDGKIFMMPETHEDNCVQLYEAAAFPFEWKKSEVLISEINAVDTVMENGYLIPSVVCPSGDMRIDLHVFDKNGNEMSYSPVYRNRLDKRGAGKITDFKGMRLRPAQNCESGNYGGGIIFNKINKCDADGYDEEEYSVISPENTVTKGSRRVEGIHTYARTDKIEIVDIKFRRINLKRLFWIIKRKAGS